MSVYRMSLAARYAGSIPTRCATRQTPSVLVIRGDAIGDFVLFLPSLAALRRYYRPSKFCVLVGSESASLAGAFGDADEVITFNARQYRFNLAYRLRLIRELRSRCFDVAVNPVYSREPLTDELLYCSGARQRITFDGNLDNIDLRTKAANSKYCTRVIESRSGSVSEIERNREFVEKLTGIKPAIEESVPQITVPEAHLRQAHLRLSKEGVDLETESVVALFPGASNAIKAWPPERFADLANRITKEFKVRIVICGASSDFDTQEAVAAQITAPVIRLAGKTDLLQLIAILKQSALYIGNDTGPLHLAAAVGTPALCILGGGHFGRFYPYGDQRFHRAVYQELECFHCNWMCPFEVSHCIHNITVDQAWQAVRQMFGEIQSFSPCPQSLGLTILRAP